jgi:hypothetical protein
VRAFVTALEQGFGRTIQRIAVVIVVGSSIAEALEQTGGIERVTLSMIRAAGTRHMPLALTDDRRYEWPLRARLTQSALCDVPSPDTIYYPLRQPFALTRDTTRTRDCVEAGTEKGQPQSEYEQARLAVRGRLFAMLRALRPCWTSWASGSSDRTFRTFCSLTRRRHSSSVRT